MAIKYISAGTTGSLQIWSSASTWNNLTLPTSVDDVYANNRNVWVDTGFTINALSNGGGAGIAIGGTFHILDNNISITATTLTGGSTSALINVYTPPNSNTTITSSGISSTATTGNIITFTGSPFSTLTINGNLTGASNTYLLSSVNGTVNISGITTLKSGISVIGVRNTSTGTINFYGDISGGTVANSRTVTNESTGTINVFGNVYGGTNITAAPAISSTTAGIIAISGNTIASTFHPALISTNVSARNVILNATYSTNGVPPYICERIYVYQPSSSVPQTITIYDTGSTINILNTSGYTNSLPLNYDVRSGITYGIGGQSVGTMIVPESSEVKIGVQVDNTRGIAIVTTADTAAMLISYRTKNIT